MTCCCSTSGWTPTTPAIVTWPRRTAGASGQSSCPPLTSTKKAPKPKTNDDKYVLSTVFFAAVLFFAGISLRLDWQPLRVGVLCLGGAMLLGGAVFVLTLPIA
jgi:hypothetical protein